MDIVPDLWEIAIKKSVTRMFLKKGKKLNYICSINPCTISKLTGTITDLNNSNMFSAVGDTFIAEFIFIARDK